jgi:hypothetical protein
MSDWPKTHDLVYYGYEDVQSAVIDEVEGGSYISCEDFDRVLSFCVGIISTMPQFENMHPQTVKEFLITEIKKAI